MARLLSVVIPVYNERDTIQSVIDRVEAAALPAPLRKEIIVVDDGSTDGTSDRLKSIVAARPEIVAHYHDHNRGKGAALRSGFQAAQGDVVIVQDADLEYDPGDFAALLAPLLDGRADVVFGSRFIGQTHRVLYFRHYVGNRVITTLSNLLSNLNLTDIECGYKALSRDVLQRIKLEEDGFGFEPEIVAKVAKLKARIYEVPVSYAGRTYEEGKKITWRDGAAALWCIVKYNVRG